jgi:hypothetical protein
MGTHKHFDTRSRYISIGSDPEFGFLDAKTHRQVKASDVVPYSQSTLLGIDGHPHLAELRPPYTHDPLMHLDYIKRIMYFAKAMMEQYIEVKEHPIIAIAGSMIRDDAMGGHIHLGCEPDYKFPTVLDTYLMPVLAALDTPRTFKRRVGGRTPFGNHEGYGRLSDYRGKDYGIEYRTPQSWLGSESIARGVLVAAWVLTENYAKLERKPTKLHNNNHYYDHNYKALRQTALFALDKILHFAAPHGREAFLSVCTLKGLIKERKRWRTHNIFDRWNFARESIQPPLLTVYPMENRTLKYILREYMRRMLPFPIHFEKVDFEPTGISIHIDPAIAGTISMEDFRDRLYGSYYLGGYLEDSSFRIAPAGGGICMKFAGETLTESVLCDAYNTMRNLWTFQDADSDENDMDYDD